MTRPWTFASLVALCAACSPYMGHARTVRPEVVREEAGWMLVDGVPLIRQQAEHDCGPAALAMVISHHRPELANDPFFTQPANARVSVRALRDHASALGFSAFVVEGTVEDLVHEIQSGRPVIAGIGKPTLEGPVFHYAVVIGLHPETRRVLMLDPADGWLENSFTAFIREWHVAERALLVIVPR